MHAREPEHQSGNIFIRPNRMEAGDVIDGHAHNFDHTTVFFGGSFVVSGVLQDGITPYRREFTGPDHVLIKAGVTHRIECMSDGLFWCIYSHRDPQGRIVQKFTHANDPAYR
jgi:quercetin dioxygenase-like cupin family protein